MTGTLADRSRRFLARAAQTREPLRAEVTQRTDGTVAVLRLYDVIDSWGGQWGVSAKEFAATLDALPSDTSEIRLHVNSPGGEVWEGLAILNALRQHSAPVTVIVDGIAASAASFVAMAGDTVVMAPNSELMIHDAWGLCIGNAAEMQKMANDLAHESDNIASIYAAKAGGDVADWRAAMAAETWYSAQEAVDAGLADQVGDQPADAQAKNRHDLTIFNYAGRAKAPAPAALAAPQTPAAPSASGSTTTALEAPMSEFTDAVRERLGIADASTDEDTILAALDEALTEHADPQTNQIPDGTVLVDAAALAELRTQAAAGAQARTEQLAQHRASLVDSAVRDGRIAAAQRDAWLAKLTAEGEPGEQVLAALAPGLIPVAPVGHDGGPEATADELNDEHLDQLAAMAGLPKGALRG